MYGLLFFFSSRRRHTRCSRDWSSDVCSSDLHPSMIPSIRSGCVQRCSEKSISSQALFGALELNKKIFSPHKQALSERMRWPAVPLPETSGDVQRRPEVTKNPEKAVEKQGLVVQR